MARRKINRGRHTGRSERGEHFAQIPVEILESEAYAALPDYAVRVLLAIASQYRGQNNGGLSLAIKAARALGIRSTWKVQAGLRLLLDTGLVEATRPGKYSFGRGICALYAITWRVINVTPEAFPPIDHERPAPNTWATWTRPDDWGKREADARRAAHGTRAWDTTHDHSRRREQGVPPRREQGKANTPPTSSRRREQATPVSSSRRGGYLLESGPGTRTTSRLKRPVSTQSSPGAIVALNETDAAIHKLAKAGYSIAEIVRMLAARGVTAELVSSTLVVV